jgi:altronate dehydratase
VAEQRRLTGFRRQKGAVRTRNHVAILPVDDLSNAAAEGIASLVPGTLALPHAFGRLQFGEDLELTFRTLIGIGSNPNVAAVVVIGIEPNWTHRSVGELVGLSQLVLLKDEVQELWARFDDSGRESFEREMLPDGHPGA